MKNGKQRSDEILGYTEAIGLTEEQRTAFLKERSNAWPRPKGVFTDHDLGTLTVTQLKNLLWLTNELVLLDEANDRFDEKNGPQYGIMEYVHHEAPIKIKADCSMFGSYANITDLSLSLEQTLHDLKKRDYLSHFSIEKKEGDDTLVINLGFCIAIPYLFQLWDSLKKININPHSPLNQDRNARYDQENSVLHFDGYDQVLIFKKPASVSGSRALLEAAFSGKYRLEEWIDANDPILRSVDFGDVEKDKLYHAAYGINRALNDKQLPRLFEIDRNRGKTRVKRLL